MIMDWPSKILFWGVAVPIMSVTYGSLLYVFFYELCYKSLKKYKKVKQQPPSFDSPKSAFIKLNTAQN